MNQHTHTHTHTHTHVPCDLVAHCRCFRSPVFSITALWLTDCTIPACHFVFLCLFENKKWYTGPKIRGLMYHITHHLNTTYLIIIIKNDLVDYIITFICSSVLAFINSASLRSVTAGSYLYASTPRTSFSSIQATAGDRCVRSHKHTLTHTRTPSGSALASLLIGSASPRVPGDQRVTRPPGEHPTEGREPHGRTWVFTREEQGWIRHEGHYLLSPRLLGHDAVK